MEDLLSPNPIDTQPIDSERTSSSTKRKALSSSEETAFDVEDYYDIDQSLLQRMFPSEGNAKPETRYLLNGYKDIDVYSSGLSPAAQEEENDPDPMTVTSTRGFAITVDDIFDLDEASGFTGLNMD